MERDILRLRLSHSERSLGTAREEFRSFLASQAVSKASGEVAKRSAAGDAKIAAWEAVGKYVTSLGSSVAKLRENGYVDDMFYIHDSNVT